MTGNGRLIDLDEQALEIFAFRKIQGYRVIGRAGQATDNARLAPGIVLLGHVIRDAIERRFPVFDFLRGEEPYKYAFGPAPTDLLSVRVTP